MKRIFDFAIATIALVMLSPLLAATAIVTFVVMGPPVFFRHPRPGKDGKLFTLVKFRTMRNPTHSLSEQQPDDQRLTGYGKFLRRTSLDELPELVNVLKGDMSLVGPRPLLPSYLPLYTKEQARRHEVRPGLTGWAQINGRNSASWAQKFEYDIWYVDNRSFMLDLRILFRTVRKVLNGEGISEPGQATMRPFEGNG